MPHSEKDFFIEANAVRGISDADYAEEQNMLLEVNQAGFEFFNRIPVADRLDYSITYDFHVTNGRKRRLIHHKLTPLVLTPDGRIWLALCTMSVSSRKTFGNIVMKRVGLSTFHEYSLTAHRWTERQEVTLSDVERSILVLSAQGYTMSEIASIIKSSGVYTESATNFNLDLRASYYLGQFNFQGGITTPEKRYYRDLAAWQRERTFYYLTAGWGNAHWKAKLDIVNPFRTDWRDTRTTISTPNYSQISDTFNSASHRRINLTLTYIFNYGKKVKRGDELGTASGGQSSIL